MARKTEQETNGRRRVQLDFTDEAYKRLVEFRDKADAKTNAELVRNALRLYEWFLEQKRTGCQIQVVNPKDKTVKQVEFVF